MRVLVVDNEPDFLETISFWLTSKGYHVHQVTSGPEALQVLGTWKPDVVLLDVRMPKVHGLETLRRLRALDKDLPVVLVTTVMDDENTLSGATALGIVGCFRKGGDLIQLHGLLERALEGAPNRRPFRFPVAAEGWRGFQERLRRFLRRLFDRFSSSR